MSSWQQPNRPESPRCSDEVKSKSGGDGGIIKRGWMMRCAYSIWMECRLSLSFVRGGIPLCCLRFVLDSPLNDPFSVDKRSRWKMVLFGGGMIWGVSNIVEYHSLTTKTVNIPTGRHYCWIFQYVTRNPPIFVWISMTCMHQESKVKIKQIFMPKSARERHHDVFRI